MSRGLYRVREGALSADVTPETPPAPTTLVSLGDREPERHWVSIRRFEWEFGGWYAVTDDGRQSGTHLTRLGAAVAGVLLLVFRRRNVPDRYEEDACRS